MKLALILTKRCDTDIQTYTKQPVLDQQRITGLMMEPIDVQRN